MWIKETIMQSMTYDEMRQLHGGNVTCAVAVIGLAAAEAGLVLGIATGGLGFLVSVVGAGAALYGAMAGCSG
jgi:hypothetical protein